MAYGEKSKELVETYGNANGPAFQVIYPAITSVASVLSAADIDAQLAAALDEEKKALMKQNAALELASGAQQMFLQETAALDEKRSEVLRLKQAKYIASLPPESELQKAEADISSRLMEATEKTEAAVKLANEMAEPALTEAKRHAASVEVLKVELAEVGRKLRLVCNHQWKTEFGGNALCLKCRSVK
jgi:hypothetical protein